MPGDNLIIRHWKTGVHVFYKNLNALRQQINSEAIHDLRVAIKKLRSYLKLYARLLEKKDTERSFSKIKELFSVLGKHRNIEMSRQLVLSFAGKDTRSFSSLLIHLQLIQDQVSEYCKQVLQSHEEGELDELTIQLERDLENLDREELVHKTRHLVATLMDNLKRSLEHFKEQSHLIRKDLKDIFYLAKIFEEDIIFTKSQLKSVDRILDHLGNIQDYDVMITYLKSFRKTILSKGLEEYDRVKNMEGKAKKKKEILLNKADTMIHMLADKL